MSARVSKAQASALAYAIHSGSGMLRSVEWGYLDIRDATVAAIEKAGLADRVKFYDDAAKWRWWWFYVTDAARSHPTVIAEVARLKSYDDAAAQRSIALDDEILDGDD